MSIKYDKILGEMREEDAGTAPFKMTAGTNLTTPEAGAIEFDGTNLFITISSTRKTIATTDIIYDYPVNALAATGNQTVPIQKTNTITPTAGLTLTMATMTAGQGSLLIVTNGGTYISWGGTINWVGGSAPTLKSSGKDTIAVMHDGTNIIGSHIIGI